MVTNKSDKQVSFAECKGVICEFNDAEKFCSITLTVGHVNTRSVNFVTKKEEFDLYQTNYKLGDKVVCKYYLVSNKKNERWYNNPILLSIDLA